MICPSCGSPIDDDADFCPECGARVGSGRERTHTAHKWDAAAAPERPRSAMRWMPIVLIIAATAIVSAVATAVLLGGRLPGSSGSAGDGTTEAASESSVVQVQTDKGDAKEGEAEAAASDGASKPGAAASTDAPPADATVTYRAPGITVEMPKRYEDRGAAWIVYDQSMNLEIPLDGSRWCVAWIQWDERAGIPSEVKEERWTLGQVRNDGSLRDVVLYIPYVDGEGMTIYGGLDTQSDTLACEYYLDCSAEEIISWITVDEPEPEPSRPTAYGLSTRVNSFWGVWAFASKDVNEALDFASSAISSGFPAEVFMTTDWENLNSEPWYVVSLHCWDSEAGAYSSLSDAQDAGYTDAYVKWSGDYLE